ncbi:hypothetical protein QBC46DRAFT_404849 [Diplogelasinospora grovesii]|uniref:Uncharacterized protein n=1 Tax=Diplogelasinospora grovesii TaxID=303347 RepID=A0AAN6S836_9PEZI|nr:hypothetical protein QBC46DRAFT_404849 [Diplogelasinospora grovesii]
MCLRLPRFWRRKSRGGTQTFTSQAEIPINAEDLTQTDFAESIVSASPDASSFMTAPETPVIDTLTAGHPTIGKSVDTPAIMSPKAVLPSSAEFKLMQKTNEMDSTMPVQDLRKINDTPYDKLVVCQPSESETATQRRLSETAGERGARAGLDSEAIARERSAESHERYMQHYKHGLSGIPRSGEHYGIEAQNDSVSSEGYQHSGDVQGYQNGPATIRHEGNRVTVTQDAESRQVVMEEDDYEHYSFMDNLNDGHVLMNRVSQSDELDMPHVEHIEDIAKEIHLGQDVHGAPWLTSDLVQKVLLTLPVQSAGGRTVEAGVTA